jgi:hypothetical protein
MQLIVYRFSSPTMNMLKDCTRLFLFIINSVTVIVGFAITTVGVYNCVSKFKSDPFTDIEH